MSERITLPAPRLQLRWISGERQGYEWTCVYELILPLREHDVRRERESGPLSDELSLEISRTHRGSSRAPNDLPYRDGAHARWDAEALGGNIPIIVLDPDGRPFVETPVAYPGLLEPGFRMVPYGVSEHQSRATAAPIDDWTVSDSETARAILSYLGIGSDASLEPGADRRRDKVASIICGAREGDAETIGWKAFRDAAKAKARDIGFLSIEDLDAILPPSKGGQNHG